MDLCQNVGILKTVRYFDGYPKSVRYFYGVLAIARQKSRGRTPFLGVYTTLGCVRLQNFIATVK